jgi:hypothetical protein
MRSNHEIPLLIILILPIILLSACGQSNQKNLNNQDYKIEEILGAWGDDASTGNADFDIYHDSIYYPDPNLWYKYSLNHDTILLFRENNVIEKVLIKNITKDSMTLEYLDYQIIGTYRRRN